MIYQLLESPAYLLLAISPVLAFLVVLIYLDSYKLVPIRDVVMTLLAGAVAAFGCFWVNYFGIQLLPLDFSAYSRYVSPVVEEGVKALAILILIRRNRIGFLVDAAVLGFSVGTGFALVENLYYLTTLSDPNWLVWLVRGLGTSMMHGGTTAIFGVVSKTLTEEKADHRLTRFLPGLFAAVLLHSFFNHFFLSPFIMTALILLLLPFTFAIIFQLSERSLQQWLGTGFDQDSELLELLHSGEFGDSRMGKYLESLQTHFSGAVVVDILCYLRLYTELSLRAKGLLIMREAGIEIDLEGDAETQSYLVELNHLEQSIGRAGKLALMPCLGGQSRNLWQLSMLEGAVGSKSMLETVGDIVWRAVCRVRRAIAKRPSGSSEAR